MQYLWEMLSKRWKGKVIIYLYWQKIEGWDNLISFWERRYKVERIK